MKILRYLASYGNIKVNFFDQCILKNKNKSFALNNTMPNKSLNGLASLKLGSNVLKE